MDLKNKKVLVLGLGVSGISVIKVLHKFGAKIIISDNKTNEELENILKDINNIPMEKYFNGDDFSFEDIDLIIKSPGIPPDSYFVRKGIKNNIEVITDLELAYRCFRRENLIAITGSNGKSTSTVIAGEIFKKAGYVTHVVGNIGTAILDRMYASLEDDVFVIESSSFQLEHTVKFKPKVSLITNISVDHIDWHGSYEGYIKAKFKIFTNQNKDDYLILNKDDKVLRRLEDKVTSKIIWFSTKSKLDDGIFYDGTDILVNCKEYGKFVIKLDRIKIKGTHNIENILGCIGIALTYNIDAKIIKETIENFYGLEHRLEFVRKVKGINFYNDSKGTNVSSSIKAIEAIGSSIILIAGGYNKKTSFKEFVESFDNRVEKLILMGETRENIKHEAIAQRFDDRNIFLVDSMEEAVTLAYEKAQLGDNVLLSPACASWGLYKNFEERGNDFKKVVYSLVE